MPEEIWIGLAKFYLRDDYFLHIDLFTQGGPGLNNTSVSFRPETIRESRKTCVKFIQHFENCSVLGAIFRYLFKRKSFPSTATDRYGMLKYYGNRNMPKTVEEINNLIYNFLEKHQIKPTEMWINTQHPTEIHEKLAELGIKHGANMEIFSMSPVRIPAIQLIIEAYFKGEPYSKFFMEWKTKYEGEQTINLEDIFNQYDIKRRRSVRYKERTSCLKYAFVYYQREDGAPTLGFKYVSCKNRKKGEKCENHYFTVETVNTELLSEEEEEVEEEED